ncbi:hypothetical protein H6G64_35120 [Calothrix sp. FACHB-156]|nr:hypothetical protein [Calothrix sp. FACHB-156]
MLAVFDPSSFNLGEKSGSREFDQWIWDYELEGNVVNQRGNKLGGYVEMHSYVEETIEEPPGRLLLELQHPSQPDDNFYFFVEDDDLINLDFSKVESYFFRG